MSKKPTIFALLFIALSPWVSAQRKALNVYTDERIELLNTIQLLSGYPILNQSENLAYKKEIDIYFKNFKEHDAVKLNHSIYREFLGFDRAVTFIMHYELPSFKLIAPFSDDELKSLRADTSRDTLDLIVREFRAFYITSGFHVFFKSHAAYYQSFKVLAEKELAKYDVINVMEKYYGVKNRSYNVALSPLLHDGGYAIDIDNNNIHDYYAIVGPVYDSLNTNPVFDVRFILSEYVLHEMSHNFCNPLIDKYFTALGKDSCLVRSIEKPLKEQGYSTWKTCLYEHWVRANEIMLNELLFGEQRAKEIYDDYVDHGSWIYLRGLVPILKEQYLPKRNKYPTENDLMGLVIGYFDNERKNCD